MNEILRILKSLEWPYVLIGLGAVLNVVGIIWSSMSSVTRTKELYTLNTKIAEQSREIADLNIQLADKSDKIAIMTDNTLNAVTGGDSFCYIRSTIAKYSNIASLELWCEGKYPVYDISIQIEDLTQMPNLPFRSLPKDVPPETWKKIQKERDIIGEFNQVRQLAELHFNKTIMLPHTLSELHRSRIADDHKEQKYFVRIFSRNGVFEEEIVNNFVGEWGWACSFRVYKLSKDGKGTRTIVKEEIDKRAPMETFWK